MADSPTSDAKLDREVDDLLGQLKSDPYGTSKRRSGSFPSGSVSKAVVGSGVAPDYYAWTKVLLVAGLGIGIVFWPYSHQCGLGLISYFAALGVLLLTAAWGLHAAWRQRTAWAYGLGLAVVVWGAGLTMTQVLPRTGYAKATAFWSCQAGMSPATTPAQPQVSPTATPELPAFF